MVVVDTKIGGILGEGPIVEGAVSIIPISDDRSVASSLILVVDIQNEDNHRLDVD